MIRCIIFATIYCLLFSLNGCVRHGYGQKSPVENVPSSFLRANPQKIAVLVQPYPQERIPERLIEDYFVEILLEKGYAVASRSDVDLIIKELGFQHSGLTDKDVAEIGRMLNVPAVLIVAVTNLRHQRGYQGAPLVAATMGARLISVEGSEVLWIKSDYQSGGDDINCFSNLASRLARWLPKRAAGLEGSSPP